MIKAQDSSVISGKTKQPDTVSGQIECINQSCVALTDVVSSLSLLLEPITTPVPDESEDKTMKQISTVPLICQLEQINENIRYNISCLRLLNDRTKL